MISLEALKFGILRTTFLRLSQLVLLYFERQESVILAHALQLQWLVPGFDQQFFRHLFF